MKDDSMTPSDGKTTASTSYETNLPPPQPVAPDLEVEEIRKHYKGGAILGMGDIVEQSRNIRHVHQLLAIVDELMKGNEMLNSDLVNFTNIHNAEVAELQKERESLNIRNKILLEALELKVESHRSLQCKNDTMRDALRSGYDMLRVAASRIESDGEYLSESPYIVEECRKVAGRCSRTYEAIAAALADGKEGEKSHGE